MLCLENMLDVIEVTDFMTLILGKVKIASL